MERGSPLGKGVRVCVCVCICVLNNMFGGLKKSGITRINEMVPAERAGGALQGKQ